MFRTTPETYPARFLAGDAFDDAHLSLTALVPSGPPPVASVSTLTELRGRISVILASSIFHLFNEEKQSELCKRLAALLDLRPGSIIFGSHVTKPVKGQRLSSIGMAFCHSPESWTKMWEEQIFEKGQVKVSTLLKELDVIAKGREIAVPGEEERTSRWLFWSVERL